MGEILTHFIKNKILLKINKSKDSVQDCTDVNKKMWEKGESYTFCYSVQRPQLLALFVL